MLPKTFDLVILGAGPAGIEGALKAAGSGLQVALVSATPPGGRATFGSLVPSKVWLAAAEKALGLQHTAAFGLQTAPFDFQIQALNTRIQSASADSSATHAARLNAAGVHLFQGKGFLRDANTVEVSGGEDTGVTAVLNSRFVLLATGSEPVFRPDFKPNGERIIAPRLAGTLKEMPRSVIIAGGGITGVEYAFAFAALGARVILLQRSAQLLRGMDASLSSAIENWLQTHLSVQIIKGDAVQTLRQEGDRVKALTASGTSYDADLVFIAAGRQADLTFFNPTALPLEMENGFVAVNHFAQTNLPGVYAAGDLTGNPMTANRAMMQARVAVAHMIAGDSSSLQQSPVLEAAYTVPGIAQIGDISADSPGHIETIAFAGLLKAQLSGAKDGFVKIKTTEPGGKILGAGAFGPYAAEILAPLQVAMQEGISLEVLRRYPFAHPGWGEVVIAS